MPTGYGNWSAHVGYKYMGFVDENLQGMNQFNAPGKSTDEIHQIYGGISVFFGTELWLGDWALPAALSWSQSPGSACTRTFIHDCTPRRS